MKLYHTIDVSVTLFFREKSLMLLAHEIPSLFFSSYT